MTNFMIVHFATFAFLWLNYGQVDALNQWQQHALDRHNHYRSLIQTCSVEGQPPARSLKPMVWDRQLERTAKIWADRCQWGHDSYSARHDRRWLFVGQNVAAGPDENDFVDRWFAEYSDYDYNSNSCAPGKMCGHYTQVVWDNSTHLGCAYRTCKGVNGFEHKFMVVCNYGGTGNFNNLKPYQVKENPGCGKQVAPRPTDTADTNTMNKPARKPIKKEKKTRKPKINVMQKKPVNNGNVKGGHSYSFSCTGRECDDFIKNIENMFPTLSKQQLSQIRYQYRSNFRQ